MTAWAGSWGSSWAPTVWLAGVVTEYQVYGANIEVATRPEGVGCGWQLCARGKAVIPDGDAVQLTIEWQDVDGDPATPTSVQYRVFDPATDDPVSPLVSVSGPQSTTVVVIPGANLPGSSAKMRRLDIQVRGSFSDGQHSAVVRVYVRKLYEMS